MRDVGKLLCQLITRCTVAILLVSWTVAGCCGSRPLARMAVDVGHGEVVAMAWTGLPCDDGDECTVDWRVARTGRCSHIRTCVDATAATMLDEEGR